MKHRDKILELRAKGFSYREIQTELGCSKGTIAYHCGEGQKDKTLTRNRKFFKSQHPLYRKVDRFCRAFPSAYVYPSVDKTAKQRLSSKLINFFGGEKSMFSVGDLLDKIGDDPHCALTGRPIDLTIAKSYHLDHIIPYSRGGTNSLDNCQLLCREANLAKSDMTPDEFIRLCQEVVAHAAKQ